MNKHANHLRLHAVILAAGESRRLGTAKQLLKYQGQSLLSKSIENLMPQSIDQIWVVTGSRREACYKIIENYPTTKEIYNPDYKLGMGNSIKKAVAEIQKLDPRVDAVLLCTCDQLLLSAADYKKIIDLAHKQWPELSSTIACTYQNKQGIPCIFFSTQFDDILEISDSKGAQKLLKQAEIRTIELENAAYDVDNKEDMHRWELS